MRERVADPEPPSGAASPHAVCDLAVLCFALWTVSANATVLLGGSLHVLIGAFVAAAATVFALRRRLAPWWRLPPASEVREGARSAPPARERLFGLAAAFAVVLVYVATRNVALLWLGTAIVLVVLATREVHGRAEWPVAHVTRGRLRVLWGLCVLSVLLVLVSHRSDEDDAFYVNLAVAAADAPSLPLLAQDTVHRLAGLPLALPVYRAHSIELLAGALARLTPLSALSAAHVVVPAAAAFLLPVAHARLLQILTPLRWIWALAGVLLFLVFAGEAHSSHANLSFVRLYQGKAILLSVALPLIAAYGIEFAREPSRPRWTRLVAVQVAAVGLSATAIWLAPVVAALALVVGAAPRLGALRTLGLGLAASAYPLAVGLAVRAQMVGILGHKTHPGPWDWMLLPLAVFAGAALLVAAHRWAAARRTALVLGVLAGVLVAAVGILAPESLPPPLTGVLGETPKRFVMVLMWTTGGGRFACLAFLSLLAVWAVGGSAVTRRFAVVFGLGFVLLWNPYTVEWVSATVTSHAAYGRVFWLLPLPVLFALAVTEPVGRVSGGRARTAVVAGCVAVTALGLLWAPLDHTLSRANGVRLAAPGPRAPPEELEVARAIVAHASPETIVLAPLRVSPWLPTLHGYPAALVVRRMYLAWMRPHLPAAEIDRRELLADLVSGHASPPDAVDLLRRALDDYPLGVVCLAEAAATDALRDVLRSAGLARVLATTRYEVWARK